MAYPQVAFPQTTFASSGFINQRRVVIFENTLLYQLEVLKSTGRYDAFKLKWNPCYHDTPDVWPVPNHLFWDSDVAKWIEGACYFLTWKHNAEVDAAVKELVDMIRGAQQPDGYINIHFTVVEPEKRFTNLRDLHELYNAGHLIEAALAHHSFYGDKLLLEPILKYVDLLCDTFGPSAKQKHGYPGHPEIELALLRLFERTKNPKHRSLGRYFLDQRGNPTGENGRHYYDVEAQVRGERENERPDYWPAKRSYWYQQAHKPIAEQQTIEGHSVRATYLLTAVADLVRIDDDNTSELSRALERLWSNMVEKKMYLTGGIGAIKQWEGFGIDYFLPSGTDEGGCYAETCAAIGVMMLAERLLQINLEGKFADIMELCFYNAVMTGMSASGKQFTYVNQLASTDTDLSKRAEWFTCACCPPNVTRLLGYIGGYLWTCQVYDTSLQINVHMFSSATLTIGATEAPVELKQETKWPWEGIVNFTLRNPSQVAIKIKIRIPGWAKEWTISPNLANPTVEKGYLTLSSDWLQENPEFRLDVPMSPRFISPHPYTNQNVMALARGPVIYCVEDIDNSWVEDHFKSLILAPSCAIREKTVTELAMGAEPYVALTAIGGIRAIASSGFAGPQGSVISSMEVPVECLHFIPYCLRSNRGGRGHMRVAIRVMP